MVSQSNERNLSTDFWWLSPEEARQYIYVNLYHQEPYSDEPNTDKDPRACPMQLSEKRYRLDDMHKWRARFGNINVFRSYALYDSASKGEHIIGPLLLDIDRTYSESDLPDLNKALEDTRLLVRDYCCNLKAQDYRIFFSGHKGFHIEIYPRSIRTSQKFDRWQYFEYQRKEINKLFGNTFVDKLHPHVRLHNSINSWIDYSGHQVYFMNFEVDIDELLTCSLREITRKSKQMALLKDKVNGHIS